MKTLADCEAKDLTQEYKYTYQKKLTDELDKLNGPFTQETINEIVLWKVDRFAQLPDKVLGLINQIDHGDRALNEELT